MAIPGTLWDGGATTWDDGTLWDVVQGETSAGGCYSLSPRCGIEEYDDYLCEDVVCRQPQGPAVGVSCAVPCLFVPCQAIPCATDCSTGGGEIVGSAIPCYFVPCLATPCSTGE